MDPSEVDEQTIKEALDAKLGSGFKALIKDLRYTHSTIDLSPNCQNLEKLYKPFYDLHRQGENHIEISVKVFVNKRKLYCTENRKLCYLKMYQGLHSFESFTVSCIRVKKETREFTTTNDGESIACGSSKGPTWDKKLNSELEKIGKLQKLVETLRSELRDVRLNDLESLSTPPESSFDFTSTAGSESEKTQRTQKLNNLQSDYKCLLHAMAKDAKNMCRDAKNLQQVAKIFLQRESLK